MSRAFVKEDVDPPERSGRVRSASGLPPGATNYMTLAGAMRLRQKLEKLRGAGKKNVESITGLEQMLDSVTVVEAPTDPGKDIGFGARVTVRDASGQLTTYRVVGVDELDLYVDAVGLDLADRQSFAGGGTRTESDLAADRANRHCGTGIP